MSKALALRLLDASDTAVRWRAVVCRCWGLGPVKRWPLFHRWLWIGCLVLGLVDFETAMPCHGRWIIAALPEFLSQATTACSRLYLVARREETLARAAGTNTLRCSCKSVSSKFAYDINAKSIDNTRQGI